MNKIHSPAYALLLLLLCSCGAYFNQPVAKQQARIGETTTFTEELKNLPLPEKPVVVGVYAFKDQTGQYKNVQTGSSFSTAVTQGATSILIDALEESKWFNPIERENLSNLLNERNIIRSTRQEYSNAQGNALPPLLYAGVLLEGGIVSYNSNIVTGGFGARYFGVGGSTQYRQDRITIYLRAISTTSGKILNSIYVSKTILSQAIDVSLFRYVDIKRLLEVETGYTTNEPVQLAVKGAIEKAVLALIAEGIEDGLWSAEDKEKGQELISNYYKIKEEEELTSLYNREYFDRKYKNFFNISLGVNRLMGDYANRDYGPMGSFSYGRRFSPHFALSLGGSALRFKSGPFEDTMLSAQLNAEITFLPYDRLGPYIYAGPGLLVGINEANSIEDKFYKIQYGIGLKYSVSKRIDFKIFAEQNLSFSDEIDGIIYGSKNDNYFNFGIGIDFNFGKPKEYRQEKEKPVETQEAPQEIENQQSN